MASLNNCQFIGNVGNDPIIRYLPSGEAVANISLAVSDKWKDKQGQKQEHTEWVRISFFGVLADVVGKYVHKGSLLYVSGQMRTRKWQDKEGQDRQTTEIRGDRMQMLDSKGVGQASQGRQRQNSAPPMPDDFDPDIPF